MQIAVIGAGIVGLVTAHELAADGHSVTVFEREHSAACGASFATAGLMAPGVDMAPLIASRLRHWLGARWVPDGHLRTEDRLTWRERRWLVAARAASRSAGRRADLDLLYALASDSAARLTALMLRLQWTPEQTDGLLVVLRNAKDVARLQPELARWRELNLPAIELDADGARQIEPALNPDTTIVGGIHLPRVQVINCRQVALMLKDHLVKQGVRFEMARDVTALQAEPSGVAVQCADGLRARFDQAVVCAGAQSAPLLAALGLRLPLQPIYGYSLSAALREPLNAPRSAVWDATHRTTVTRSGQRVRVAGVAQLGGKPGSVPASALQTLRRAASDWFPVGAAWGGQVQIWQGARPTLPDGLPVIGASGIPGVWLNVGHADAGWTLALGSARLLADQVGGRAVDGSLSRLGVQRFQS